MKKRTMLIVGVLALVLIVGFVFVTKFISAIDEALDVRTDADVTIYQWTSDGT